MRFGLHSGQHQVSIAELRGLWSFARQAGFDACYLFDHFRPLFSDVDRFLPEEAHSPSGGCLEAFTTLGSLARSVPQIRVGIMVAGAGYRSVSLVGHMTATLAQAAPGRVELGLGAGWFEPEYVAYGYPYPEVDRRLVELRTSLEWLRTRLRDGAFAGAAAPRLWVAGRGPLIRLAAEHADSWNTMFVTPKGFGRAVEELAEACAAAGRDPSSIERSVALRAFCSRDPGRAHAALEGLAALRGREVERVRARSLVGSPEDCAEQLAAYVDAGANHLAVMVHPPYDLDSLSLLGGEVFPRFRTAG